MNEFEEITDNRQWGSGKQVQIMHDFRDYGEWTLKRYPERAYIDGFEREEWKDGDGNECYSETVGFFAAESTGYFRQGEKFYLDAAVARYLYALDLR
jgi:hypothetical protein